MAVVECSVCRQPFREVPPGVCKRCRMPTSVATAPRPDVPSPRTVAPGQTARLSFPWGIRTLDAGELLNLGRDPEFSPVAADLADFPCVSRKHAVIVFSSGVFYVQDNNSTNKTYVDGELIAGTGPVAVSSGSVVSLGGVVDVTLGSL